MPHSEWSVADAKSKLSEVLNRAEREAQRIRRHGREYVLMDGAEYRRLTGEAPDLKALLLNGPSLEGVDVERDKAPGRDCEL